MNVQLEHGLAEMLLHFEVAYSTVYGFHTAPTLNLSLRNLKFVL